MRELVYGSAEEHQHGACDELEDESAGVFVVEEKAN